MIGLTLKAKNENTKKKSTSSNAQPVHPQKRRKENKTK